MTLGPDQIPLGLSGSVCISKEQLRRKAGARTNSPSHFLFTEEQRLAWLAKHLDRQLDYPLLAPGSGGVARKILSRLPAGCMEEFARKLLQSVRDGKMHSTTAIAQDPVPVAVCFVTWQGSWRDQTSQRYGLYLSGFFSSLTRISQLVESLAAYLQIDAFIAEDVDAEDPLRPMEDSVTLDVEFTYASGHLLGNKINDPEIPKLLLFNMDLCSDAEKDQLKSLVNLQAGAGGHS